MGRVGILSFVLASGILSGCPAGECDQFDECCKALFELRPEVCQQREAGLRTSESQCQRGRESLLVLLPDVPEICR
ncbi:MAG: hypothetical protein AAFZ18_08980 [Myxococcota bacterium]